MGTRLAAMGRAATVTAEPEPKLNKCEKRAFLSGNVIRITKGTAKGMAKGRLEPQWHMAPAAKGRGVSPRPKVLKTS